MALDVRLGTDLDELVSLRPDWTMTTWDPAFFPGGEVLWLSGRDEGQQAFVIAARLFLSDTLYSDIKNLRIFYGPSARFCRNDECYVIGDIPELKGPLIHTGNLYVFPAYRGRKLGALATRLLHLFALQRWPQAQWVWGLQEKELAYKGLWQDQGYPHCTGQVIWKCAHWGETYDMKLVYGSRAEILASLG